MPDYKAPVSRQLNTLKALPLGTLPQQSSLDDQTLSMVLGEAAKLAEKDLASLNQVGDKQGLKLNNGVVTMPAGFKDAYGKFCADGWGSVPFPSAYGGQELPWVLSFALQEMWQASNMSFGLCPLLTQGAADMLVHYGTEDQKNAYLPKLVSGEWTGTMNLTEPQAGTNLADVKSKADPAGDGSYRIKGQKIFISYGEHDMADNIIHLVLARTPGAPEGVKGISLFLVPKILPDGARNDLICSGIEHKMGIHASPTCTMNFGDNGGATGWLIGQENEGLKLMFTMMNNARLHVGLQGVAISERAFQAAQTYAAQRVQGTAILGKTPVTIDQHPDVARMLLQMESMTAAARALTYLAAYYVDSGNKEYEGLLTPLVKSFSTDTAVEVTSLGVQVHGGMGFIEETGAAQYYRDARILPIYEGTNGVQAADLMFRKMLQDKAGPGATVKKYAAEMLDSAAATQVNEVTDLLIANAMPDLNRVAFVSTYYQNFLALHFAAAQLKKVEGCEKLSSFFNSHVLPRADAEATKIRLSLAAPLDDQGFKPQ